MQLPLHSGHARTVSAQPTQPCILLSSCERFSADGQAMPQPPYSCRTPFLCQMGIAVHMPHLQHHTEALLNDALP